MTNPLNIGIAGLGTVGMGTYRLLIEASALIESRCGRKLQIAAISARDKNKERGLSFCGEQRQSAESQADPAQLLRSSQDDLKMKWVEDALDMARDPSIDVVVELIGGAEGVARQLVEEALKNGKHVVTANKALIAHHGIELAKLAEKHRVMLAFEAAVAGGIPIIKALRDGLAANAFESIAGILNGTCNYILSAMSETSSDFAPTLAQAQKLGYAEADPSFDVDGIDTAHKLAILASLAYGCPIDISAVHVEGIRNITRRDIEFAQELGYKIKLLGIASRSGAGIVQRVHPAMVPGHSAIGATAGVFNAVQVKGDAAGSVFFQGRGAGAGPTASSVVADIMDIARGVHYHPFTLRMAQMRALPMAKMEDLKTSYYLRLAVIDQPGVVADVAGILRDGKISVQSLIQHSHAPDEKVQVVITTHETKESSMMQALAKMAELPTIAEPPHMVRIESF